MHNSIIRSVILRTPDTPLHFLFLADEGSVATVAEILREEHPPFRLKVKLDDGTEVDRLGQFVYTVEYCYKNVRSSFVSFKTVAEILREEHPPFRLKVKPDNGTKVDRFGLDYFHSGVFLG